MRERERAFYTHLNYTIANLPHTAKGEKRRGDDVKIRFKFMKGNSACWVNLIGLFVWGFKNGIWRYN